MNPGAWQDIPGFEGLYQIHSAGAVRSVNRDVKQGSRWGHLVANAHRGRVLKPFTTGNGRQRVVLHDAAHRRHSCYIDTLLKTCFAGTGRSDYHQQTSAPPSKQMHIP